jgi:hypothetical protein
MYKLPLKANNVQYEECEKMNNKNLFKNMPVGLALSLGMNEFAMEFYTELDNTTRENIKNYIQSSNNGAEAKSKIKETIKNLEKHDLKFLD